MIDYLRQLAILSKTVDHGSFRGAADALRLSPSVVSHHISQLEEYLGTPLLYRTTRKLALTAEGEELLGASQALLTAVETKLEELKISAKEPSGALRITVPSVLSQSPFIETISEFNEQYPRVKLSLDFSDLKRELVADGFDISIRMSPKSKQNAPGHRNLFSVNRYLVCAPNYLKINDTPKSPQDLENSNWLELTPARNIPVRFRHKSLNTVTIHPKSVIDSNDAQSLYQLAKVGAGIALVPSYLASEDQKTQKIIRLLPDWNADSLIVSANWPLNAPKHGLVRLLVDFLTEASTDT